jgi:hypothetical protein
LHPAYRAASQTQIRGVSAHKDKEQVRGRHDASAFLQKMPPDPPGVIQTRQPVPAEMRTQSTAHKDTGQNHEQNTVLAPLIQIPQEAPGMIHNRRTVPAEMRKPPQITDIAGILNHAAAQYAPTGAAGQQQAHLSAVRRDTAQRRQLPSEPGVIQNAHEMLMQNLRPYTSAPREFLGPEKRWQHLYSKVHGSTQVSPQGSAQVSPGRLAHGPVGASVANAF